MMLSTQAEKKLSFKNRLRKLLALEGCFVVRLYKIIYNDPSKIFSLFSFCMTFLYC